MDAQEFIEVLHNNVSIRVVRVGYWRLIKNLSDGEALWIWDGPLHSGPTDPQSKE
jgi:hypothetical protein